MTMKCPGVLLETSYGGSGWKEGVMLARRTLLVSGIALTGSLIASHAHAAGLFCPLTKTCRPWHQMSQYERNRLILDRAIKDLGRYVGRNCKEWAHDVVSAASGGLVYLPWTTNGGLGWYWENSPSVSGMCKPVRNFEPGEIIQMNCKTNRIQPVTGGKWTPHTAIVYSMSSVGVTVIESNWDVALSIAKRPIPFDTFTKQAFLYTVYDIL